MIIKVKNKLQNKLLLSIAILFACGSLCSFSLPPYNYVLINFLVYPTLFLFLTIFNNQHIKLLFMGLSFGFGFFASSLYWISNSLTFDETFKILIPISLFVLPLFLSFFYGLIFLILSFLTVKFNFSSLFKVSMVFSLFEFFRGTILSGFPWNLIVFSLSDFESTIQILSFIGTYALNLLAITFFLLPSIFLFKLRIINKLILSSVILLIILLNIQYGNKRIENYNALEKIKLSYAIKIVSPKIKLERYFSNEDPVIKINELIKISSPNTQKKTLFIFPEGILTGLNLNNLYEYRYLFEKNFSENHDIILGINSIENEKIYNTLVLLNNKLEIKNKYKKNKLVPFGEYLPLENELKKFGIKKITQGYKSFSSSDQRNLIEYNGFNILPLICYEIIYSGNLSNNIDYDLIVNISEDGWFGESIGPYQHLVHSKFRSIEEGKNIIRSSNNGYSGLITPIGNYDNLIESTESGVILVKNLTKLDKTLFASQGNKIFFYFNLIYISLVFLLKRKGL